MVDNLYVTNGPEASAPALRFAAVTPSDTASFARVARALFVGTGGNVVVVGLDQNGGEASPVTFTNVQDGSWLPVRCVRVNETDTTASNIVWVD